jgi:hypothetical protein
MSKRLELSMNLPFKTPNPQATPVGRNPAGQFIYPERIPPEEEEDQAGQTQEQGGAKDACFKGRPFKIKSAPTGR